MQKHENIWLYLSPDSNRRVDSQTAQKPKQMNKVIACGSLSGNDPTDPLGAALLGGVALLEEACYSG